MEKGAWFDLLIRRHGDRDDLKCDQRSVFLLHGPDWPLGSSTHSSMNVVFNSPSLRQLKLIHFLMAGVAATRTHNVPTQQGWAFLKSPGDIESSPRFNHGMGASVRPPRRPGLFWFCKQNGTVCELALHSVKSWHKHHPDTEISLGNHSGCISVFFLVSHALPFTQRNMFTLPCVHQSLLTVRLQQPFDPVFSFEAL